MEKQNNQGKLLVSALKVRKNSRCRIGPFAVLKLFSIFEVTLHNEIFFLLSEHIVIGNLNRQ
jgi:hypothetical protein